MPAPKSAADCPEGFSLAIRNPGLSPGVIFNPEHPQLGEQINAGDLVCIPDAELAQHVAVDAAGGVAAWLPAPASRAGEAEAGEAAGAASPSAEAAAPSEPPPPPPPPASA